MTIPLSQVSELVKNLPWTAEVLAEKLSLIGHESEAVGDQLNVVLTSNRKDCQKIEYLLFDLIAAYPELGSNDHLITYQPGKEVPVTLGQVNKLLGSALTPEQYQQLTRLGFAVEADQVTIPDFRSDIVEAADIAEEVFRLVGVKEINIALLDEQPAKPSPDYDQLEMLRLAMVEAGFHETRAVSFTSNGKVSLKNPFNSELPYLRESLQDGLLQTLAKNPFMRRCMFFEIGNVFLPAEETHLGIIVSGHKDIQSLNKKLSDLLGVTVRLEPVPESMLNAHGVKQPLICVTEIPIAEVNARATEKNQKTLPVFKELSKYPPLVRDISVKKGEGDLTTRIREQFPDLLLIEQIDSYNDPETQEITDTYRLILQKHQESFTNEDILAVDKKLAELL